MPADIVRVRSNALPITDFAQLIHDGLSRSPGQKTFPTILLYDEKGLQLYDKITVGAPEYYLFPAEEQILKDHADDIVKVMHHSADGAITGEVVLELGAGALRKTSHVLSALGRIVPNQTQTAPITYYALDLEQRELERTLGNIEQSQLGKLLQGKVRTRGLCATYEDGLNHVRKGELYDAQTVEMLANMSKPAASERSSSPTFTDSNNSPSESEHSETPVSTPPSSPDEILPPLHIMFLGSSLGNFDRDGAANFLRSLPLRPGCGDTLLIGLDHNNGKALIEKAYNDSHGHTTRFIMNGLRAAGRALGNENLFDEANWEYVNRYDAVERKHEAFFKAKSGHSVRTPGGKVYVFEKGELVKIEESFKFSEVDTYTLFSEANLRPIQRWMDKDAKYSLWLLERPPFMFPLLSSKFACSKNGELIPKRSYTSSPTGVVARQEWDTIWALWDFITLRMIPPTMLYERPIDLRHICLFYLGHIPTFLDIHLSRLLQQPHTEPDNYKYIFERGIDPDVDDPTKCHPHSEVPQNEEDWPTLSEILDFQARVRARLMKLYDEIDSGERPLTRKIARVLWMTYEHEGMHAETLLYMLLQRAGTGTIPPVDFFKPEWTSLAAIWDAAPKPTSETVVLGPEKITLGHDDVEAEDVDPEKALLVDGHEFGWDNEHPKRTVDVQRFEISWRPITNGEFYEFYLGKGKEKVELPASWVMDEDGVIQVRTLYGPVPMTTAYHWPVMASYDSLSTYAMVKGGRLPTEPELRLFFEKFNSGYEGGGNTGFRAWHPVPATTGGALDGGKGTNGGVWEWTSTTFDRYDGFIQSKLYPGYSTDFFDGKHQVVLGGSYATIPRISERGSFRNWYQRNYPYPWVGARIVYDVKSTN